MCSRILSLFTALALGACTTFAGGGLEGVTWRIEEIAGRGIVDASQAEILFGGEGGVGGTGGCNRFFAGYTLEGARLTIETEIGMTLMACPEPLMAQDRALAEALASVDGYLIDETGTLRILAQGETVVRARR